ncbi:hypothetical protein L596_003886 [Steinernema carpocapsae]|uniref:Uncharacterized protein n=1 Tax=Steinernema carpocapsae TaxID=34508 RepID=A0A4U8UVK9_STECR|nr:hypothetical protein L596_003886 [Steinernema carpocapsae]
MYLRLPMETANVPPVFLYSRIRSAQRQFNNSIPTNIYYATDGSECLKGICVHAVFIILFCENTDLYISTIVHIHLSVCMRLLESQRTSSAGIL